MSDSETLRIFSELLRRIPGVTNVLVTPPTDRDYVFTRVRCDTIEAIDALAFCGMASNYQVKVSEIASRLCGEPEDVTGLPCEVRLPVEVDERPNATQIFAFFLATWLYKRQLVADDCLDHLEEAWPVSFQRYRG